MASRSVRKTTSSTTKSKHQNVLVTTGSTSLAVVNSGATTSVAADSASATKFSELYFYRNKSKLLELDLARTQAKLSDALQALGRPAAPALVEVAPQPLPAASEFHSNFGGSSEEIVARDTLIGSLQQELARRDDMMRLTSFRVAWKYERSPRVFRVLLGAIASPVVFPYLVYRALKVRLLAKRGDR